MHTVRTGIATTRLARLFAHAFIPIALAYLVAHYFSLVVFQEQAQFTFLLSDPLGEGSDLFGTVGGGIDYGALSANAIWYVEGALVVGHVTALALGHDRALAVYSDARSATRSQYWMLALMVGFTRSASICLAGQPVAGDVALLAHAGHWAIWVLYAVLVVIVLASIVISLIRDRGRGGAEHPDPQR